MGFSETMADLDHILKADRDRKAGALALLQSVVDGLDGALLPPEDEPVIERRGGVSPAASAPFTPMPRRTTHGGAFGPAVRAKLRSEAVRKW